MNNTSKNLLTSLIRAFSLLLIYTVFLNSCTPTEKDQSTPEEPKVEQEESKEQKALTKQITVAPASSHDGYILYGQENTGNGWTTTYDTIQCTVGYNGIAQEGMKREGDGKTPAGMFTLGSVFGYEDNLGLEENFIDLEPHHYWISDSSSDKYNTLVDYNPAPLEAEVMLRDDHLYKYGIIVNYNTAPVVAGKGSAIFIHVYRSPEKPTAGCVGISEGDLVSLINWTQDANERTIRIVN